MKHNPDIYLLYEYMEKLPFTIRLKIRLDETVDPDILSVKAQEAFKRFPYFSKQIGVDDGGNFVLEDNFDICFQLINKDRKPLDLFLQVLDEEKIPYSVSSIKTRYLPKIDLPKA